MRVAGATIVRNAIRLEYPFAAAIRSILPLVDEVTVNVGRSDDGTLEAVRTEFEGEPVRILDREWDSRRGGAVLADETDVACSAASADWVVYIQADEVMHEAGASDLRGAMERYADVEEVEGLLVNFVHHYSNPGTVATSRTWYKRETRVTKSGIGVSSYHEAQGFRVGGRRIRAAESGATYHHYGWARPAAALFEKTREDFEIYGRRTPESMEVLPWQFGLKQFGGEHPVAVQEWLTGCSGRTPSIGPRRWTRRQIRMLVSDRIENLTGRRLWEYRNFREV